MQRIRRISHSIAKLVTRGELQRTIERAGYDAGRVPRDDARIDGRARRRVDLLRVVMAWLSAAQVLMLSLPLYIAAPGAISAEIARLLQGAGFVLTLPALLFSAQPLYRAAWSQLRMRRSARSASNSRPCSRSARRWRRVRSAQSWPAGRFTSMRSTGDRARRSPRAGSSRAAMHCVRAFVEAAASAIDQRAASGCIPVFTCNRIGDGAAVKARRASPGAARRSGARLTA